MLAKGSLNNVFQDSFNTISSLQLTHDRSYISQLWNSLIGGFATCNFGPCDVKMDVISSTLLKSLHILNGASDLHCTVVPKIFLPVINLYFEAY